MSNELQPLSDAALQALSVERARPPAPDEELLRLAARLEASFALPELAQPSTSAPTVAAKGLRLASGAKVLLFGAGLAVGGLGGAQLQARFGTPREVVIERRIEVRVPAPPSAPPATPLPTPEAPRAVDAPRPRPVEARAPKPSPSAIDVERLLIEQATSALSRGQGEQALAACARHAEQFPAGQLAEERESLAIRALAALGRGDEARARAAAFRSRFPDSLLLEAVNAAVAEPAGR